MPQMPARPRRNISRHLNPHDIAVPLDNAPMTALGDQANLRGSGI
ncbi:MULTISPECIES: hypothetical protein [unclassified Bradyrhizobium]|nr:MULTISPECIES: hypothetical protein [unclassified Bradyrhizobium]